MQTDDQARLKQIELQNEKLALDIQVLRDSSSDNRFMDKLGRILTQLAPAITVLSLLAGVIQYTSEQRSQRVSRNEATIRASYTHLVSFPRKPKVSVAETTLDFQVLARLLDEKRRDSMNGVLVDIILRDLDFNKSRDVDFTANVHSHWPWFEAFARTKREFNIQLAEKCLDALAFFASRNGAQVEKLYFAEKVGALRGRRDAGPPRWSTYRHVQVLLLVFARTMERLKSSSAEYKSLLNEFQELSRYKRITRPLVRKTSKGFVFCNIADCAP